jgi:two-component system, LytTR family, response regulator
MKRVLIVEDEEFALEDLKETLLRISPALDVATARTGPQALDILGRQEFDVVLLDLELPGLHGFDVLRQAPQPTPPAIIVTAHALSALDGFGLGVVDCLLKPVEEERLKRAFDRLASGVSKRPIAGRSSQEAPSAPGIRERVLIRVAQGLRLVKLDAIYRIEQTDQGTRVFFEGGSGFALSPLIALDGRLDPQRFFRVNESNIINFDHLDTLEGQRGGELIARFPDGLELKFSPECARTFEREHQI